MFPHGDLTSARSYVSYAKSNRCRQQTHCIISMHLPSENFWDPTVVTFYRIQNRSNYHATFNHLQQCTSRPLVPVRNQIPHNLVPIGIRSHRNITQANGDKLLTAFKSLNYYNVTSKHAKHCQDIPEWQICY